MSRLLAGRAPASALVIGGGVIGLCAAEALSARGLQVSVLERGSCGSGASSGNAGWLTPSLALPIPGPGVIAQSLRWLVDPSGPLWIRPTLTPAMLAWVAQFVVSCSARSYRHGTAALQAAGARAAAAFDALAERGARFECHADGLIYPAFSSAELEHLLAVAADLAAVGLCEPSRRLSAAELRVVEPALSEAVIGGLAAPTERRVRPESLLIGLRHVLAARGVEIYEHTLATGLRRDAGGWLVATAAGAHRADAVVVANGVGARDLLADLGVRLALAAAKGYSRTYAGGDSMPRTAAYLEGPKVAITTFDGAVRVSGTLELGARDLKLSARRLQALSSAAAAAMPGWQMPSQSRDWAGMRSLSPDGLPYIGALAGLEGVFVSSGHATLGVTLAPLSGELLAELMFERGADPLLAAFDPARCIGVRRRAAASGPGDPAAYAKVTAPAGTGTPAGRLDDASSSG